MKVEAAVRVAAVEGGELLSAASVRWFVIGENEVERVDDRERERALRAMLCVNQCIKYITIERVYGGGG